MRAMSRRRRRERSTAAAEGAAAEAPPSEDRRLLLGGGLPSNPRVSVGEDPDDDKVFIKTSSGQIITVDAPPRGDAETSSIYWRQVF